MFGFQNFGIIAVYSLCILSTILCVVYGVINWNKGASDDEPSQEQTTWQKDEAKKEEDL